MEVTGATFMERVRTTKSLWDTELVHGISNKDVMHCELFD